MRRFHLPSASVPASARTGAPFCSVPPAAHRAAAARALPYDPAAAPLASGSVLCTVAGRSPPTARTRDDDGVGPTLTTSAATAASADATDARSASPSAIASREIPQHPCVNLPPTNFPAVELDRRSTVPPPRACLDAARLRRTLTTTARTRDDDGVGPTLTTSAATVAPAVALAARHASAVCAPFSTTTASGQEHCLVDVRSLSRRHRCTPSAQYPVGQCSGHAR